MPAVITSPPIPISGNPPLTSLGNIGKQNHLGPFVFGSNLYLVLLSNPSTTQTISVFKSTDNGATWVLKDSANGPDTAQEDLFATADSGTLIEIIYADTGGNLITYIPFDPGTDTYGSTVAAAAGDVNFRACRFADGTFLALYPHAGGAGLDFVRLSAGVWTAPATAFLSGGPIDRIRGLVGDATGVGHFTYQEGPGPFALKYRQISALDVVSAATTLVASGAVFNNGPMEIWNSRIEIPGTSNATGHPVTYEGTPVAAPVWTIKDIDTSIGTFVIGMQISSGSIAFWWVVGGTILNYSLYDGTTFGAPVEYYDATNIPPPGGFDPGDNFISGPTVGFIAAGRFGVALTLDFNPAEDRSEFFLLPSPSVICDNPPEGTVGTAYSHFFPASSGTPPYAWSISAGALPDGLSIDAGTGEVSGTPTVAGHFGFTVLVTDSADQTGSVVCSIDIALLGPVVQCNNPPPGKVNVPYSHNLFAFGGVPPYTWAIVAGSLPPGLSLDGSTGTISGTPTTSGTFTFTVQITDSDDVTAETECSIIVKTCLVVG